MAADARLERSREIRLGVVSLPGAREAHSRCHACLIEQLPAHPGCTAARGRMGSSRMTRKGGTTRTTSRGVRVDAPVLAERDCMLLAPPSWTFVIVTK